MTTNYQIKKFPGVQDANINIAIIPCQQCQGFLTVKFFELYFQLLLQQQRMNQQLASMSTSLSSLCLNRRIPVFLQVFFLLSVVILSASPLPVFAFACSCGRNSNQTLIPTEETLIKRLFRHSEMASFFGELEFRAGASKFQRDQHLVFSHPASLYPDVSILATINYILQSNLYSIRRLYYG